MRFHIAMDDAFLDGLLVVPPNRTRQILQKIDVLGRDALPDGHQRIKLTASKGGVPLYRIRSGDYRVLYTIDRDWVTLRGVDDRQDVYEGHYSTDRLDFPNLAEPESDADSGHGQPTGDGRPGAAREIAPYLPRRIDEELLRRLRIPDELHPALTACRTEDDLLNAPVPGPVLDRLMNVLFSPDPEQMSGRPSYVLEDTDDLLRYVEGDLPAFLLKLDPVQERMVDWGMKGSGPTLVKGGPGTGKSTVALYRTQAIVKALRADGNSVPRVLFTTYTNALVSSSEQLLRRLLGPHARYVEVRTADQVVHGVMHALGIRRRMLNDREMAPYLHEARRQADLAARSAGQPSVMAALARVGADYLQEEINKVIESRELSSLEEYLAAARPGRRAPLNASQRTATWRVYEQLGRILDEKQLTSYERARRHAATLVRAGARVRGYDGVVIDEVQDLDPSVLRLLVLLCAQPNRLFITADANQSIYGSSFRWTDVHEDLRFRGRTEALRRNYRSTREIGEAAASYLRSGSLDDDEGERSYAQSGGYMPALRAARDPDEESGLLARFLPRAGRALRLGRDSCAILVPTRQVGEAIAARLTGAGIAAEFMEGRELNLEKRVAKVITLKSAKGLEFPIVAIAGFVENPYFGIQRSGEPGEREERLLRERRGLFVGMTRAMRALLVVTPLGARSPLLDGFDAQLWNIPAQAATQ